MFSKRLKELRFKHNISQKQLAEKLGVSQQSVAKWEKGDSTPKPSAISEIANIFSVSSDYLLGIEKPHSVSDEDIKFALFGGDGEITDDMYEDVISYARFIKERKKGNINAE